MKSNSGGPSSASSGVCSSSILYKNQQFNQHKATQDQYSNYKSPKAAASITHSTYRDGEHTKEEFMFNTVEVPFILIKY